MPTCLAIKLVSFFWKGGERDALRRAGARNGMEQVSVSLKNTYFFFLISSLKGSGKLDVRGGCLGKSRGASYRHPRY